MKSLVNNMKPTRIIYCAKASKKERNLGCENLNKKINSKMFRTANNTSDKQSEGFERFGTQPAQNNHPTVKPLKLMEYLCLLTKTPKGGIVLDPFAGSGTTGMAAKKTGRDFIGIEKEPEYCKIAEARIKATQKPLL